MTPSLITVLLPLPLPLCVSSALPAPPTLVLLLEDDAMEPSRLFSMMGLKDAAADGYCPCPPAWVTFSSFSPP